MQRSAHPFRPSPAVYPTRIRSRGVRLKLVSSRPRRYRSSALPGWVFPLSAGWMLGLGVLLGMAVGQGKTENRLRPVIADQAETLGIVLQQSAQAECVAVAYQVGLTQALRTAMVGAEMAQWAPLLLTERQRARCAHVEPVQAPPEYEMHWGALEAP